MEKRIQEEKEQLQRELYIQFNQYGNLTDEQMEEIIEKKILESDREYYLSVAERQKMKQELFNVFRKLDVLSGLLEDDDISEIMVNGKDHIFIEKRGRIYSVAEQFTSEERLRNVIQQIVSSCNRIVNETVPIVDARLEDGSRVNVVLPPIALDGAVMTIRKFPKEFFTMHRLIKMGSITREAAAFLEKLVKAKYNIFISGGTGSGKTTFLNALSNYIPSDERVITIEDSAELQIRNIPNLVRLETRNANSAGVGAITIRDLIKSSLRMRPERIVVGEVRGAEALDMLQAMNTGHDGSLSTGHANSAYDMLSRLETMVLSGEAGLPLEAIRQQIASAVDIIVHLSRMRDKTRKTMEITEVVGMENGAIILNPLFKFEEDEDSTVRKVSGSLKRTNNKMVHPDKFIASGIYDYLEE